MKTTSYVLVLSFYSIIASATENHQTKNCDIKHMDNSATHEQLIAKGYNIVPFAAGGNNFVFAGGGVQILNTPTVDNNGTWITMAGLNVYQKGVERVSDEQIPSCEEMYNLAQSTQLEKNENLSCAIEKKGFDLVNIECHLKHLNHFSTEAKRLSDLTKKVSENVCTFLLSSANRSDFSQFDLASQSGRRAQYLIFDFLRFADVGTTDPHGSAKVSASFKCLHP